MINKIIWFDFENAPHVWVLKEFVNSFKQQGIKTLITARDFSVTIKLAEFLGINVDYISQYKQTKWKISKFYRVLSRGIELAKFINNEKLKPVLAISHGSRSQAFAASILGIPIFSLDDYEYSSKSFNIFVNKLFTPFPIPQNAWGVYSKKVIHYPGLKEELYLWNEKNYLEPNNMVILDGMINIIFRPEGTSTHYRSIQSKKMQDNLLDYFGKMKNIHVILIARDKIQEQELINIFKEKYISYTVPPDIQNGPSLISHADLFIGGGGTMAREAAILSTPSYTFFGGKLGHVDKFLIKQNKLVLLSASQDLDKIVIKKKETKKIFVKKNAFDFILNILMERFN